MVVGPLTSERPQSHTPGPKLMHDRMGRMESGMPVAHSRCLTLSVWEARAWDSQACTTRHFRTEQMLTAEVQDCSPRFPWKCSGFTLPFEKRNFSSKLVTLQEELSLKDNRTSKAKWKRPDLRLRRAFRRERGFNSAFRTCSLSSLNVSDTWRVAEDFPTRDIFRQKTMK